MTKDILRKDALPRSIVWRVDPCDGWVYKEQRKTLCDNEMFCLERLVPSGYVPQAERLTLETMRTRYMARQPVTEPSRYLAHMGRVLDCLRDAGIRHGDLTVHSVIPHDNRPYLIDFAESRLASDPRPDKRLEGDAQLLDMTMRRQAAHNERAPNMWWQIKQRVDFHDKTVVDLGCGYGDMVLYTHNAGAKQVTAIERDSKVFEALRARLNSLSLRKVRYLNVDIESVFPGMDSDHFDIAMCFSVLPYVSDYHHVLQEMRRFSKEALIECQYTGDGPGMIDDQDAMASLLQATGWDDVRCIGQTYIKTKNTWRDIWHCRG